MNQLRLGAFIRELEPVHAAFGQAVAGQVWLLRVRRRAPRRLRIIQRQDVGLVVRRSPDGLAQLELVRLAPTIVRFSLDRRGRGRGRGPFENRNRVFNWRRGERDDLNLRRAVRPEQRVKIGVAGVQRFAGDRLPSATQRDLKSVVGAERRRRRRRNQQRTNFVRARRGQAIRLDLARGRPRARVNQLFERRSRFGARVRILRGRQPDRGDCEQENNQTPKLNLSSFHEGPPNLFEYKEIE